MKIETVVRALFGKRSARVRGLVLVPGLVALVFSGHAFEDGGWTGAAPLFAIIALSVIYAIRPMLVIWLPLFGVFAIFGLAVAFHPDLAALGEWFIFLALGFVPAALLWFARPRPAGQSVQLRISAGA